MAERAGNPSQPQADGKQNGGTNHNSTPASHLPAVEHDKHVRIYIEEEEYDPEAEQFIDKIYPDDSHIHDDHELAKPRTTPVSRFHAAQLIVKSIVEHIVFRLFTILLIITEFVIVIIDLAINADGHIPHLSLVSQIIMGYFILEIMLRLFYKGELFFHSWMDILDMAIVLVTFIIDVAFSDYARLGVIGRSIRIMRIVRGIYLISQQRKHIAVASRRIVSQNKRRYVKDGFDLDLCYITERVIAMSFPSSGVRSMYRNNILEVSKFFESKHKGHYKIYNSCSEREYDVSLFDQRVERIYIDDHNVPTLKDMIHFCESVHAFLSEDPENVVAVHCKGGKGRTGTLICTWLVECGKFEEAQVKVMAKGLASLRLEKIKTSFKFESLEYFGDRRTDLDVGKTFQGVETPSQSRYVGYFSKVRYDLNGSLPPKKYLKIRALTINAIKGIGHGNGNDLTMEVWANRKCVYKSKFRKRNNCILTHNKERDCLDIQFEYCPVLVDDIKVRFCSKATNIPKVYDNCAFYFWFHTAFAEDSIFLTREEIDNPHKKRAQKVFREKFSLEMFFENASVDSDASKS